MSHTILTKKNTNPNHNTIDFTDHMKQKYLNSQYITKTQINNIITNPNMNHTWINQMGLNNKLLLTFFVRIFIYILLFKYFSLL